MCLIIVSTGLSVVTMCIDLASTHLKAYFTRFHYFGRAKKFLGLSEELKEIIVLLRAMRKKKGEKVCVKFSFIKFHTIKNNWNSQLAYLKPKTKYFHSHIIRLHGMMSGHFWTVNYVTDHLNLMNFS